MLVLNPESVMFDGVVWPRVVAVVVDRDAAAEGEVLEWGDAGPQVVFADVVKRRVDLTVRQELVGGDGLVGGPPVGSLGVLMVTTAGGGSDAGKKTLTASAVVLSVTHELARGKSAAVRTVRLVAVSGDGVSEPVVEN